jgi:hypothetical protein
MPEGNCDLLPIDTGCSHALEIAPEPEDLDHTADSISRIADLEGRLKAFKQQALAAMKQAKKSAALSQHVSSLEEQMYVLKSKIIRLEDGLLYMTELIEGANK